MTVQTSAEQGGHQLTYQNRLKKVHDPSNPMLRTIGNCEKLVAGKIRA